MRLLIVLIRTFPFIFQALLSVLLILLFVWRVDVPEALGRMRAIDGRWMLLGAGAFVVSRCLQVYRWRLSLWHWKRLPAGLLTGIYFVSMLANTLIPLRGGDVLRVQIAGRRLGITRAELTAAVFAVETPLNWAALLLVAATGLAFLDMSSFLLPFLAVGGLVFGTGIATAFALSRLNPDRDFGSLPPVRWLPRRVRQMVAGRIPLFLRGLEAWRSPGRIAAVIAVGLLIWLVEVMMYGCLAQAFRLDLDVWDALVVMIAANLVLALPLTPGHIGPYQVAVAEVAVLLGVGSGAAGSFAIGAHLLLLGATTLIGILATWWLRLGLRDLLGQRRPRVAAMLVQHCE